MIFSHIWKFIYVRLFTNYLDLRSSKSCTFSDSPIYIYLYICSKIQTSDKNCRLHEMTYRIMQSLLHFFAVLNSIKRIRVNKYENLLVLLTTTFDVRPSSPFRLVTYSVANIAGLFIDLGHIASSFQFASLDGNLLTKIHV